MYVPFVLFYIDGDVVMKKLQMFTLKSKAAKYHKDHHVAKAGVFLDSSYPFIRASPDGIVSFKWCGEGVFDVKCSAKFCTQKVEGEWSLKRDHLTLLVFKFNAHYTIPFFSQQEIQRLYTKVKEWVADPKLTVIHPCLSYTVHFIDHNWDLKSFYLEIIPLFDDNTGANISESIADIMTKCQLSSDKLVVKTTTE